MDSLRQLLGESPALEGVRARARRLLTTMRESVRVPHVLIQGETGSGKGLLARALHDGSQRSARPFVAVNCAAIPDTLAESELFGFEAGAHSEARRAKPGLFQAAAGGTIFLDEVGLLSGTIQTKLLKVIEDRRVRRVGGIREEPVDVWIISATNADLQADVVDQKFRADLYQRLAVVRLTLPPLRERVADIMTLADEFIARTCADYGLPLKRLAPAARTRLAQYPWPGNVRELSNVVERAVLLADGDVIDAATLELDPVRPRDTAGPSPRVPVPIREYHLLVLRQTGWNISHAAARLGISRNTLRARIERFGLRAHRAKYPNTPAPMLEAAPASGVADSPSPDLEIPGAIGDVDVVAAVDREGALPEAGPLCWERRRVTVLRVNLAMPDDADPTIVGQGFLDELLRKARLFGGHLDGLSPTWAAFSFGAAHREDGPMRAALAALAIQRAASRWPERDERRLGMTSAIEAAHLAVAQDGPSVQIDCDGLREVDQVLVELVSRCEPGWIGVGPQIGPFLARRFELARIEDPVSARTPAYRLIAPKTFGQDEAGAAAPYVGREAEIALLKTRVESVRKGHGQVVAVVGEPGVGKSRLLSEFCRTLAGSDARVLHAAALLPDGPSLFPAIELLRRYLNVDEGNTDAEVRLKIDRAIPPKGKADKWSSVALAELLGVPAGDAEWSALAPSERREQRLNAISRVLLGESRRPPLVLVFEDLHWVDSETQALIDRLVEAAPAVRVLVLVAYRPEYQHQWAGRTQYSELWLEALPPSDATRLLGMLMGNDPTLAGIKDRLVGWTEGNPFFLEEAVRYLGTTGVLAGEPGRYRLARPDELLQVPPTVEDVLAERIDRLVPEARDILECAAVIGREAPQSVLSAIVDQSSDALSAGVRILLETGLLNATESALPTYRFKHQLTHEVTFRRLTPERRRFLHGAVLRHLEGLHPTPQGEALDQLAFHAFRAECWTQALTYCRRAGERAYDRSSNPEAAEYFRQARTCLEHLPETEDRLAQAVDVLFGLRWALWSQGRLIEMGGVLRQAEQHAARLGDPVRQGMVAAYLTDYLWATGDNTAAIETGTRALTIAEGVHDDILAGQARFGLALARAALGQYREAVQIVGPAVEPMSGGSLGHQRRVIVMAKAYLARYLAELGEFTRGVTCAESGLVAADLAGDSFALLGSLLGLGTLHLRRGDMPAAISALSRGLETARSRGQSNWVPSLSSSLGLAYTLTERSAEGLDLLSHALVAAEGSGISASQALWTAYAAEGHVATGRFTSGRDLAERGLELARGRAERGHEAWALRALANALAGISGEEVDHAVALMEDAATSAEALGMRPLAARCRADLSRLLTRCGRGAEAKAARGLAMQLWNALGMVSDPQSLPPEID